MSLLPAARVTDPFGHTLALEGLVAGLALGALLAAGIAATGGFAAVVVGAVVAVKGSQDLASVGKMLGASMQGPPTGLLTAGSRNVTINGLPAAMMTLATGECVMHDGIPQPVASGAARVLINGMPAARITDTMVCGAVILKGSQNMFIGGPTQSPVCAALRREQAAFERFRIDAQAAAAAYDPPDKRTPPEGYRNATTEDLAKLRLTEAMLEHPIDRKSGKATEFRAAVFINNHDGRAIVAYKGTTSTADWLTNVQQGTGRQTFYYDQAQRIAQRIQQSPDGIDARLTGHSLGGGLASAGSEASGLPATTFNAAGLDARTVPHAVPSNIDAVHVNGEILTTIQSSPGISKAAATRSWPIDPVDHTIQDAIQAALNHHVLGAAKLLALRCVSLHGMNQVEPAIAHKQALIAQALIERGCE